MSRYSFVAMAFGRLMQGPLKYTSLFVRQHPHSAKDLPPKITSQSLFATPCQQTKKLIEFKMEKPLP